MKVIDLIVAISKSEEVPKKVKFGEMIFEYDETDDNEILRYYDAEDKEYLTDICHLNTEIEIIEDTPKKIEKVNLSTFPKHNNSLKKTAIKLNEIIDYINNMERENEL